jgi:hypothetical protein
MPLNLVRKKREKELRKPVNNKDSWVRWTNSILNVRDENSVQGSEVHP